MNSVISIKELWEIYHLPSHIICIVDNKGIIKNVNPSFAQTLRYPEESLVGKPFSDFVHPEDIEANNTISQNQGARSSLYSFTNRMQISDGSFKTFLWTVSTPNADGQVYAQAQNLAAN